MRWWYVQYFITYVTDHPRVIFRVYFFRPLNPYCSHHICAWWNMNSVIVDAADDDYGWLVCGPCLFVDNLSNILPTLSNNIWAWNQRCTFNLTFNYNFENIKKTVQKSRNNSCQWNLIWIAWLPQLAQWQPFMRTSPILTSTTSQGAILSTHKLGHAHSSLFTTKVLFKIVVHISVS